MENDVAVRKWFVGFAIAKPLYSDHYYAFVMVGHLYLRALFIQEWRVERGGTVVTYGISF